MQNILTYLLIVIALFLMVKKLYHAIYPKKINPTYSHCTGCAGCELKNNPN